MSNQTKNYATLSIIFFLVACSCSTKSSREANRMEGLYIHKTLNIPYIEDTEKKKYILDTGAEASILLPRAAPEFGFFFAVGRRGDSHRFSEDTGKIRGFFEAQFRGYFI